MPAADELRPALMLWLMVLLMRLMLAVAVTAVTAVAAAAAATPPLLGTAIGIESPRRL
jgi:hypothetical protein